MPVYYDPTTDPYHAGTSDADSHPYGTVGGLATTAALPYYMSNISSASASPAVDVNAAFPSYMGYEKSQYPVMPDWTTIRAAQEGSSGAAAALASGVDPTDVSMYADLWPKGAQVPGWVPPTGSTTQNPANPNAPVNPKDSVVSRPPGGAGSSITSSNTGYDALIAAQKAAQKAADDAAKQNAIKTLQGIFNTYGLSSLYEKIKQYVQEGYSADTVAIMLRDTDEYRQRFPAMKTLASKGRAISEAAYIDYERTASQFEKQYGLPSGMLTGNVTKLLENDISATEMAERVQMASANSLMAPQELKDTLSKYYGISGGDLAAYFLDPTIAEPILQKRAASARIGSEALQQGIGLDVYGAENLQSLGVSQEQARAGFQQIAGARELFSGAGDITSENEMIQGLLAGNQEAMAGVQRAAGARKARFQQGGEYLATSGGAIGLGSAAT